MADAAPVTNWASDVDRRRTFFNKDGSNSRAEARIRSSETVGWNGAHNDDRIGYVRKYSEAFDARLSVQMEYRLRRADGEYRSDA